MAFQFSALKSDGYRATFGRPISTAREWFNRLQLQHKIGWSFGLAVSVALIGITAGWGIAESALRQAQVDIEGSEAEREMLNELKISLLRMHLHQKGAILTLNDLSQWTEVYEIFLKDRENFQAIWHSYRDNHAAVSGNTVHDHRERRLIADLATSYAVFAEDLDSLVTKFRESDLEQLSEAERRALQIQLTQFNNEALRQDAYRFLAEVKALHDVSSIQLTEAIATLDRVKIFRLRVTIASAIASLGVTALLILLLSRAISSSVETAVTTATQVIETSNFDLQIPVTSTDEIGKLSVVLNRLIEKVKHLLQQEQEKSDSLATALGEVRSTQLALIQTEKMSALGQMVAGIAHEINNPVTFIHGNIEPLQSYVQDLTYALQLCQKCNASLPQEVIQELENLELDYLIQDSEKILTSMQDGTQRILNIVLSLRNFSRLDESDLKSVDLHEGIESTLTILAHRLKETAQSPGIEIIKHYAELPKVECYAGLLNQVFMNILSNAIDALEAMNQGRSYEQIEENPNQICICTEVIAGDTVSIRVTDNGPGVPEEAIDKLFNPFFTTKAVGKGTGLGLSISYKIVADKHQGTLQCRSLQGQGTEFVVQLPVCQESSDKQVHDSGESRELAIA